MARIFENIDNDLLTTLNETPAHRLMTCWPNKP